MTAALDTRESIGSSRSTLLHGAFLAAAERREATALICDDHPWHYDEIARRASFMAEQLRTAGAGRGTVVAVLAGHGWQEVVGVLAVLGAGAAYLALDPRWPRIEQRRLLDGAASDLVLAAGGTIAGAGDDTLGERRHLFDMDTLVPPPGYAAHWCPAPSPEDVACVAYAGDGPHGPLYGRLHHRAAATLLHQMNARLAVYDDDEIFRMPPLETRSTVYDLFGVLSAGGTVIVPSQREAGSAARCLDVIDDYGVTILETATAPALALIEEATHGHPSPLLSLRLVILAGRRIPPELARRLRWLVPAARIVALWSDHDAATGVSTERVEDLARSRGPIWAGLATPPGRLPLGRASHPVT